MSWKEPFLGIDFGTAYSVMAWIHPDSGQAEVLHNREGEEQTRSVVYYGKDVTRVGTLAEAKLKDPAEAERVVLSHKRDIGKKKTVRVIDGNSITPFEVAVEVFSKLKRDAEKGAFNNKPVNRAVVAVPASFDPVQVQAIKDAATKAGFTEVKILSEPVAAAIAYLKAGQEVGQRILVFDLGAGTFDVAVLDRSEDNIEPFQVIQEPRGQPSGGDDFDRLLMTHVRKQLSDEVSRDHGFLPRLQLRCRDLKETLSFDKDDKLTVDLPDGTTHCQEISREKFEELIETLLEKMLQQSEQLAKCVQEDGGKIDTLVLIGGSSRIPLVSRRLHEILKLEPRSWHKQDVAVALGAAHFGEILWGAKSVKEYRETMQAIQRMASDEDLNLDQLRRIKAERDLLKISARKGQKVEEEALGRPLDLLRTAALRSAKAEYKKALGDIPNPGTITDNYVETLDVLSKKLGLTGNQTKKFEVEVLGNSVRKILKEQKEEEKKNYKDYLSRAKEQFKLEKLDEALGYAQAAIDIDSMELDGFQLKLEILKKQKKWKLAIAATSQRLRLDPGNDAIRYERALCHLENRRYTEALADFDKPLSSVPKNFKRVTDDLEKQEKWELAIAAYSRCLQLDPGNDAIRYKRALCHLGNRSYTEALADFDHVLSVDSHVKEHRFRWRAVAKYHLGDVAGAVDDLELATSDQAGCTRDGTPAVAVWTITGILFSNLEDFTKAQVYLSAALRMRGKVRKNIGPFWLYFNQKNKNGTLKKASVMLPPAAGTELGSFYDFVQLELWDVCHALNPDSLADAVQQFDDAVQESKPKPEISDDVYEKLIRQERNSTFGVEVIKRFVRTGRPEEAIKWINWLIADLNIDVSVLQGCSEIKRSSSLRDYLKPTFSFNKATNFLEGKYLTVSNCSPFSLTKVVISIKVTRTDGEVKRATQEEKILGIDKSTSLKDISCLDDPGTFGGKIKDVQVTLNSQQGRAEKVE